MSVIPVKYKGYCQGVVLAISIALKTKKEHPNEKITILGMLVHNMHVVNKLKEEGIEVIEDKNKSRLELLDLVDEGIVIFTAHGVSDKVRKKAKEKGLTAAREILRIMNRNTDAKSHMVMVSLYDSLHGLNSEQFDIFSRLMLINDIYAFKANNPNADLPMEFTTETLKADKDYLVSLARKDKKILNALITENENNKKARQDLINLANELGFASLAKRLKSTDLFLIQYAKLLGGKDFNTNYVIAIADMRTTMLRDLERLLAVKKIKEKGCCKI